MTATPTTIYIVKQVHLCDDPYYQGGPMFHGAYRTREAAQAAVDEYTKECEREYREIFELADDESIEDGGYLPLWEQFGEMFISEIELEG
jgi:hypothetical protein